MVNFKHSFFVSVIFFSIKWFFISIYGENLDIISKIIFYLSDSQYFTLIHNLANIEFSPTYSENYIDAKFLAFPLYSLILHSIFYSVFSIYGFILVDFVVIFSFFLILNFFFKKIGFTNLQSILLATCLFSASSIIDYFDLNQLNYIASIKELYNMRIPRPSVSHLYLFIFFYYLVLKKDNNILKFKDLVFLGFIFAAMFSSYYYNLIFSGIIFVLFYFYKASFFYKKFFEHLYNGFFIFFFFILFSLPTFFILLNVEPDYVKRVGLIDLDFEKRLILINHFLHQFLSIKFILIVALIFSINFYLIKKKIDKYLTNFFLFIVISIIFGPILFITLSPSISEPYHISNMVISLLFFIIFIQISLLLKIYFNKIKNFKNLFLLASFLFCVAIFAADNVSRYKKIKNDQYIYDHANLMKKLKQLNFSKDYNFLTLDQFVQTNLIYNDYKNLEFIIGINTSLNDSIIEKKLTNILSFFNFNELQFYNYIKNFKSGWRYINGNIAGTFYMKYQANSLVTYKNTYDFNENELNAIINSSPLHSQQLILPNFEIQRLIDVFKKNKLNNDYEFPDVIIINYKDKFSKNIDINLDYYCMTKINSTFTIYTKNILNITKNCS